MRDDRDRGAITVELALTLPAVVALMAILLAAGSAAVNQIALTAAARAGARAAALGLADAEVEAAAEAVGGTLTISVSRGDGLVTVKCGRQVAIPPFGSRAVRAEAAAMCEPARGCG
ncbi:MAG: pilus assembly protein [Bifidobacteriaceae bacterium]|jgi:Flp pilus assembly protein TadG|nr:pilus assembly protein [Bifidobacteriaceae bacterium]